VHQRLAERTALPSAGWDQGAKVKDWRGAWRISGLQGAPVLEFSIWFG
jgi:hypothetical protein